MPIFLNVQAYRGAAPVPPIGRRFGREGGIVGRGAGSDLLLDDPTKYISRAHARVEFRDGAWFLVDIGTNPSMINGQPLGPAGPARLTGGERIDIGDYALVATVEEEQGHQEGKEGQPTQLPAAPPAAAATAPAPASVPPFDLSGDPLAAASIVNGGSPFAEAFDPRFDPLGLNLAASAVPSAGAAYRGAESDHAPPEQAAFAIPHDYDPLADLLARPSPTPAQRAGTLPTIGAPAPASGSLFEPPPASTPEPAPPFAQAAPPAMPSPRNAGAPPAPPRPVAPSAEPAMRTVLQPAGRPAPGSASPAAQPLAGSAPAPASPGDESRVLQALLRGLGLPDLHSKRSAEELAELAGVMLREATAGTIGVLMARTLTKRESRVEMTMIAPQANNPLKFFPDAGTALAHMLQGPLPGYLPPERAFAGAFIDLRAHELAVIAGTRAALASVLRRFDPAAIEERLQDPGLLEKMFASSRKTRMWDQLVALYGQLAIEADADFSRLFGDAFAAAYEEQVRRLRDAGH